MLHHHYPAHETECDNDRLQIINRMIALVGQIGKQTVQVLIRICKTIYNCFELGLVGKYCSVSCMYINAFKVMEIFNLIACFS